MQFMSSWAADDNRTLLHFSKSTLVTCLISSDHLFLENGLRVGG